MRINNDFNNGENSPTYCELHFVNSAQTNLARMQHFPGRLLEGLHLTLGCRLRSIASGYQPIRQGISISIKDRYYTTSL